MSLTPEDVKKIAHLARLNVLPQDVATYTSQLSSILHFIETLNQADTKQIHTLAHPLDISQRLRVDEITAMDLREKYQKIAPQVDAGLYLVPNVMEGESDAS